MNKKFILVQASSFAKEKENPNLGTWIINIFDNPYKATEEMNDFVAKRISELLCQDQVTEFRFKRCYSVFAFSCCQLSFVSKGLLNIEYYAVMDLKEKE